VCEGWWGSGRKRWSERITWVMGGRVRKGGEEEWRLFERRESERDNAITRERERKRERERERER